MGDNYYRLKYYDAAGKEFTGPSLKLSLAPLSVAPGQITDIQVYPNPSRDRIVVPIKEPEVQFSMMNSLGHSLPFYTQYDPSKGWVFDISELKSGVYLLKSIVGSSGQTHRFVVF